MRTLYRRMCLVAVLANGMTEKNRYFMANSMLPEN
jgi:hypothetical protein